MPSLAEIEASIKAEIDIDSEGKGTLSIRGTAKLCDIDHSTLSESFATARSEKPSKLAEKLTQQEFEVVGFGQFGVPDLALIHILEYYGYYCGQRSKELARLNFKVLAGVGTRIWMQKVKGWTPKEETKNHTVFALPEKIALTDKIVSVGERLERLTGEKLNPYLVQQIKDIVGNILTETNQKLLTECNEEWHGVVAVAERMGYSVSIKGTHNRGFLGAWIRCFYPHLGNRQDIRLCNETQQEIFVYGCHDEEILAELQKAIAGFFKDVEPSLALKAAGWFKRNRKPKLEVVNG